MTKVLISQSLSWKNESGVFHLSLASPSWCSSSHFELTSHPTFLYLLIAKQRWGPLWTAKTFGPSEILEKLNTPKDTSTFELIFTTLPSTIIMVKIHLAFHNSKAFYFITTQRELEADFFFFISAVWIKNTYSMPREQRVRWRGMSHPTTLLQQQYSFIFLYLHRTYVVFTLCLE